MKSVLRGIRAFWWALPAVLLYLLSRLIVLPGSALEGSGWDEVGVGSSECYAVAGCSRSRVLKMLCELSVNKCNSLGVRT